MRILVFLIIAGVILNLLKALTLALVLLLIILLLWALITRPRELLGFLILGLLSTSLQAKPVVTILCIAAVAVLGTICHFWDSGNGKAESVQSEDAGPLP